MSIAALFTVAQVLKQCKCPSVDEWTNEMWSLHTTEYYSGLKRQEILPHATTWVSLGVQSGNICPFAPGLFYLLSGVKVHPFCKMYQNFISFNY